MMAASPRMRNALTLFSSNDCVLCHRVRLVLAAKGVTYDLIPVDPQNPPEDLVDLNPYHSVPTLFQRDLVLYAARVVSEYLDERYPRLPALGVPLPKDGKAIEDYGNRIFRNPGFTRSLTEQERRLRDLPA